MIASLYRWNRLRRSRSRRLVFCTIATKDFLPWALVLFDSLRKHHPNARRLLLYVSAAEDPVSLPLVEGAEVIDVSALVEPKVEATLRRRYTMAELCFSLKPRLLRHTLDHFGDRAIYLDSDIDVRGPLEEAVIALEEASVVLTPHLDAELPFDGKRPSDLTILRAGIFNVGFIGVAECNESRRLLEWWDLRVRRWGFVAPEWAYQGDQKWMDLAPALFPGVRSLRDPGSNLGYWNLHSRKVTTSAGRLEANGRPLSFLHFSGLDPANPAVLSRFQNRITSESVPVVMELARDFAQRVMSARQRADDLQGQRNPLVRDSGPIDPQPATDAAVSDTAYRARLEPRHDGGSLETAEEAAIDIVVTNDSPETWSGGRGIGLSWHLFGEHGEVISWSNPRSYLAHDLAPGALWEVSVGIRVPNVPGRYRVEFDLVHEFVAWFADKGSPTASVELLVGRF